MTRADLIALFQQELPGEDTHVAFAPIRGRTSDFLAKGLPYKESAVAIVLYKIDEHNMAVLVTRRQTYEGKHSGQLSFPGGKREVSDENLLYTAIRECNEEIGLELSPDDLVGKLSPVYIPVSGFLIDPYVFFLDEKPEELVLNEREVKQLHEVSLFPLFKDESVVVRDVEVMPGQTVKDIPHFVQDDVAIWGATAILLNELKALFLRKVQ
jgi:8-oxo-dGTP pyrophosphatase MutT (NUDIX family)